MASLIGTAIGGLAGLFGGGTQNKVQTNGTITNNQTGSFNTANTTAPNFSNLQKALMSQFTSAASSLYNTSTNLQPYESSGMSQINAGSNAAQQAINAQQASQGLSFSPAASTAQTQNTLNRVNQQTQLANSIPLLQRQLQQQSLGQLMQAFQVIPTGTTGTQSGTTTQSGTQTQQGTNLISGNPEAGLFSGLGSGMYASGLINSMPNLFNSLGNNSSQLANFGSSQSPSDILGPVSTSTTPVPFSYDPNSY